LVARVNISNSAHFFLLLKLQLFDEAPQDVINRPALNLVAVLYCYGSHYSAFLYHAKRKTWVCVDDSYVKEVCHIHRFCVTFSDSEK